MSFKHFEGSHGTAAESVDIIFQIFLISFNHKAASFNLYKS